MFNDELEAGDEGIDELQQDNGHSEELQQLQQVTHSVPEPAAVVLSAPPPPSSTPAAVVAPSVVAAPPAVADYPVTVVAAAPPTMPAPVTPIQMVVPEQQVVAPQQHINGGLVSPQELSSVVAPAPQQAAVVAPSTNNTARHTLHQQVTHQPVQAQSPPQESVAPHHPASHVAQQVRLAALHISLSYVLV